MAVKIYYISRSLFAALVLSQGLLLSKYVVDYHDDSKYFSLGAMFLLPLVTFWITMCRETTRNRLGVVWLTYMLVLVTMIGWIYGLLIKEDIIKNDIVTNSTIICSESKNPHSFFDAIFLKLILCLTPGAMLLLLTSIPDENGELEKLCLLSVLNLFDGVEMLEVLNDDVCNKIPEECEIAVLVAAMFYFLVSFLEICEWKFDKYDNIKQQRKTAKSNVFFQFIVNLSFLVIRLVVWLKYRLDSPIFIAKNIIALIMVFESYFEEKEWIKRA